jgi:hypothetical protein
MGNATLTIPDGANRNSEICRALSLLNPLIRSRHFPCWRSSTTPSSTRSRVSGSGLFDPGGPRSDAGPNVDGGLTGLCLYLRREGWSALPRPPGRGTPTERRWRGLAPSRCLQPGTRVSPRGYAADYNFDAVTISFTGGLLLGDDFIWRPQNQNLSQSCVTGSRRPGWCGSTGGNGVSRDQAASHLTLGETAPTSFHGVSSTGHDHASEGGDGLGEGERRCGNS